MTEPAPQHEDYPLSEVPESARQTALSLAWVLLGFTFFTATMWAGGSVGAAFRFWPDLIALVVAGNLLLGVYVALLALASARTGLSTILLCRFAFGRVGAGWPDLLLGFTQVGWYAWGTATMALVLAQLTGVGGLWPRAFMVLFGLLFCSTAWVGYRGLELLSVVAVPTMVGLIAWSFAIAFRDVGGVGGLMAVEPSGSMTVATALTVIMGTFASGGTQATNWTRYARSGRAAVVTSLVAFFLGNGLMVFAGALGGLVYGEPDIVQVLARQGLLLAGIAMLFLNIWTTQDNTIYNFSVAGCALLRTRRRRLVTLVGAALGTAAALAGMYDWLLPYLVLLATVIPPIGGVILADYFVVRRGAYPPVERAALPALRWSGAVAYLGGTAAAAWLPGVPPVNGIVAAFALAALLGRLEGRR